MTLELIAKLIRALEKEEVSYCHWESNTAVEETLRGINDLDILVSKEDEKKFVSILSELNFLRVFSPHETWFPGIHHYYGYDEVAALAEAMVSGLADNAAVYPAPPVLPADLTTLISAYAVVKNDSIAAQAAAEQATVDKDDALEELVDAMKSDVRYAENTVDFDDDKLKLIGWAGRRAATALTQPGQTRLLEAPKQGDGWVFLDWKAPIRRRCTKRL